MASPESTPLGETFARQFGREPMRPKTSASLPNWIAVIGNHLPRQCGIATFTADLCNAICDGYGRARLMVIAVNDPGSHYEYPSRVRFELIEGDSSSYEHAADFLNASNVAMVSLQHEYGIYGGAAGSLVLRLLRRLKMPVVTTLHTVLREPDAHQRIVMEEIVALSDRLIVMSKHSSLILREVFHVPAEKVDLIPHGVPDLPFVDPDQFKCSTGNEGKVVILSWESCVCLWDCLMLCIKAQIIFYSFLHRPPQQASQEDSI